jgi:hypothetical protein
LARGHRRRGLAGSEFDGERRLGGPVTRPGRGGACRHCSRRQAGVVCPTASRDEPGIHGPAPRQPGAQAVGAAGFSLKTATAAGTPVPLCEPNRAGEAV